jgi:hypothetical protein
VVWVTKPLAPKGDYKFKNPVSILLERDFLNRLFTNNKLVGMLNTLKQYYCYLKKILGFKDDDDWYNNPFIIH